MIARLVAPRVGHRGSVTALDRNPNMIDFARRLPAPSGAPVTWIGGDAAAIPLEDAAVETVYCQQGLQFFADPRQALA